MSVNARGKKHPPSSIENLEDEIVGMQNNLDDEDGQQQQQRHEQDESVDSAGAASQHCRHRQQQQQQPGQRSQRQKMKASPLSDPCLLQAIEEARYEAFIDPYRGLGTLLRNNDGCDCFVGSEIDDMAQRTITFENKDDDSRHDEWDVEKIDGQKKLQCPWKKCATVLTNDCQNKWKFSNWEEVHGVMNIDDDNVFYNVENAMIGTTTSNTTTTTDDEQSVTLLVQCGCPTVDKWAMDEFELDHKLTKSKKRRTGGERKRMKLLDSTTMSKNYEENAASIPRLLCGKRNTAGAGARHPCDYNPYCLASLGGIVDYFRHSTAKIIHAIKTNQTPPITSSNASQQKIFNDLSATLYHTLEEQKNANNEERMNNDLRGSSRIDITTVQGYVSRFLAAEDATVCECMERIESFHRSLVFDSHDEELTSELRLSKPPGLHNLGATCYLNSQLQCLAQNLGFIRGLFSWTPSESATDDRMSTIISSMQSILVRMRYGPDSVLYTNDFATALSLENDEMQDPNEFTRLLFDRMEESFRRSAKLDNRSGRSSLEDLLPSVFGGRINYITKCSRCGQESTRGEDFMELLIPIAENNASNCSNVDVQHCVDSYLRPENLTGDNQYECSTCEAKCDAVRFMKFGKLPPVLNIQLARYVFDRATQSKRKLMTKVLLPKSLEIPSRFTTKCDKIRSYVLCAVQNHLGISAHGGHYVANVMDWTTGLWYELNDEEVVVLDGGPASSFEPPDNAHSKSKPPKKIIGSQDAYNLLYVEQHYLEQQCQIELRCSELLPIHGILSTIDTQRRERYKIEAGLLANKKLQDDRIHLRHKKLLEIFDPSSKLFFSNHDNVKYVWIDSNILRRIFSLNDDLADLFDSASMPISSPKSFLCEHSRLHPRVARTGKLLPQNIYEHLESIMSVVYSMYLRDQGLDKVVNDPFKLCEYAVIDIQYLPCIKCRGSYMDEMRRKLNMFTTMLTVYRSLTAGTNDLDSFEITDSSKVYAISRSWVTTFRKYVEKTISECTKKSINELPGGVDIDDFSAVMESNEAVHPPKLEDPTAKITCQHNQCHLMHNRQSARLIHEKAWNQIIKIFPQSRPHCYEYKSDFMIGNCAVCYLVKESEVMFPDKFNEWKNSVSQSNSLTELLKRGGPQSKRYPSEIDLALQGRPAEFSLVVVHHEDLQRWRDCFYSTGKSAKKKNIHDLLFISSLNSTLDHEWKHQSTVCQHAMTSNCVSLPPRNGDVLQWLEQLSTSNFELLNGDEHAQLLISLSSLESILHCENNTACPLPLDIISPPNISIHLDEDGNTVVIKPLICERCCHESPIKSSHDDEKTSKPTCYDKSKPENKTEGPMCRIFVYEVENGISIDVATSQIVVEVSEEKDFSSEGVERPRRSRKARGGECRFPVYEINMALDGNLAHFRLLLYQLKSKRILGQKLFLIRLNANDPHQYEELDHASNVKSMLEIVFGSTSSMEEFQCIADNEIHLVLSYDDSNNCGRRIIRRKLTPEEEAEEEALHYTLLNLACVGWNAEKSDERSSQGTRKKERRQERGFQGTFLQSADFDLVGIHSTSDNEVHSGTVTDSVLNDSKGHSTTHSSEVEKALKNGTEDMMEIRPIKTTMDSVKSIIVLDDDIAPQKNDSSHDEIMIDSVAVTAIESQGNLFDQCVPVSLVQVHGETQEQEKSDQVLQLMNSLNLIKAQMDRIEHQSKRTRDTVEKIWVYINEHVVPRKVEYEEDEPVRNDKS